MNRPAHPSIGPAEAPVEVVHHLLTVTPANRTGVVAVLADGRGRSLVFARIKRATRKLARQLGAVGIPEGELHGDLIPWDAAGPGSLARQRPSGAGRSMRYMALRASS